MFRAGECARCWPFVVASVLAGCHVTPPAGEVITTAPPPTNPGDDVRAVTDVAGGALCAGDAACPVDFDTAVACTGSVDSLRIAPGAGGITYATFGVVPVNRTTRALLVNHAAPSVFASTGTIPTQTLFVLPSLAGDLRLGTESYGYGVNVAWWNGGSWQTSQVPDASAIYFFDGAVGADGSTYILYGLLGTHDPIVLGTRSPAGTWSRQQLAEDGANGGLTIDPSAGLFSASWEGTTPPALTLRGGGATTVLPASFPTNEAQLSLRITLAVPAGGASPVVAAETSDGATLLASGAAGWATEPPPTPAPAAPLTCGASWANGCQPSSCTDRGDALVPESLAVAADASGGVWAAYLWRHVDADYTVAVGNESCPLTMVADRSTLTLYMARVSPDGSAPEVRWRAPVDLGVMETAITFDATADRVLVGLLGGNNIRLLSLSRPRLDALPAIAP